MNFNVVLNTMNKDYLRGRMGNWINERSKPYEYDEDEVNWDRVESEVKRHEKELDLLRRKKATIRYRSGLGLKRRNGLSNAQIVEMMGVEDAHLPPEDYERTLASTEEVDAEVRRIEQKHGLVPEAQPIASRASQYSAASHSNSATSSPRMNFCSEKTRSTAPRISGSIARYCATRSIKGMGSPRDSPAAGKVSLMSDSIRR